tara:strand:+ start:94 stop:351 length:258 start_codon:yes stop_codon:yes gene_type:complete
MLENDYLELANDAQKKYNELNERNQKNLEELKQLKKELITCYGYVRILDNVYNSQNNEELEPQIQLMIEVLREFLSQFTEDNILN